MTEYHYHKDNIKKLSKLQELQPELFQAFRDFDSKTYADGALSTRVKEIIAVACTHITQCPYCIVAHTKRAKKAGASDKELAEAIFVAMAIRAGGALAHSTVAIEAMEEEKG